MDEKISITRNPTGRGWILSSKQLLPRKRDELFPFFAEAKNLERLTPPFLNFKVLEKGDMSMREGLLIDYKLKLHGIPLKWRSEISLWDPPFQFVDQQRRGPYSFWHHLHTFEEQGDNTLCVDRVEYGVPLGAIVEKLFVRNDLLKIFSYRKEALAKLFPAI